MKPFEITKNVFWVGAVHPDLRLFDDLFPTKNGTTYNSYLIKGRDKTALIDTVKNIFTVEFLSNLKEVCDLAKIDYLIVNHTEPDHSGSIAEFLKAAPQVKIFLSKPASIFLKRIVHKPFDFTEVNENFTLDLGGHALRFFMTPFLHWPDTIFTYLAEDKILFPCDAFGCHFFDERMYNDKVADFQGEFEFYFDCIMRPFKKKILAAIEKIKDLPINMIGPSHGPILRTEPLKYVQQYKEFSTVARSAGGRKKIVVLYLSSHKNTEHVTQNIADGLNNDKCQAQVMHITETTPAQIRDALETADGVLIGSPTINRDAPKPVWDVLSLFSSVSQEIKLAGVFGSYGWSGEAGKMIEDRFKSLKLKVFSPDFKVNFVPTEADLQKATEFGKKFAEELCR